MSVLVLVVGKKKSIRQSTKLEKNIRWAIYESISREPFSTTFTMFQAGELSPAFKSTEAQNQTLISK